MKKTLLVLGAGLQAVEGIEQLRQQNWFIVGCDGDENAPGFSHCDDQIVASVYHAEECVPAVARYHEQVRNIDGVMCLAVDTPHVVARIAERLGLIGLPVEIADLGIDKIAMKRRFNQHNVPTSIFDEIASPSELISFATAHGPTVVVKPVDSRGSKGVSLVHDSTGLEPAYAYARDWSPTGRVMVEAFLPGPQLSTESVVLGGIAHTIGISDRNYELLEKYAPHIIENGGELPSVLPNPDVESAREAIQMVADAFAITDGVIKGDIVINDGVALVIEVALRLSGGYFCSYSIPLNTGISTIIPTAKIALGLPVAESELIPTRQDFVVQRYIFPEPGRVKSVSGLEAAMALPGVAHAEVWVRAGDQIVPPENAGGSAGMVITCAKNRSDAHVAMQCALSTIQIETAG